MSWWPFSSASSSGSEAAASSSTAPATAGGCPVDHGTRAKWIEEHEQQTGRPLTKEDRAALLLSKEREISSIPRWRPSGSSAQPSAASTSSAAPPSACPMHEKQAATESYSQSAADDKDERWVYPSPSSFYTALQRKQRDPQARDMSVVVPIHNAVNERAWQQILEWERAAGAPEGSSRLVSFVGKPNVPSPKARWRNLLGYTKPFDRHDWLVDRASSNPDEPSQRVRYVIDFYSGRSNPDPFGAAANERTRQPGRDISFFLDVRPALDDMEGVKMRASRLWQDWTGSSASAPASSAPKSSTT